MSLSICVFGNAINCVKHDIVFWSMNAGLDVNSSIDVASFSTMNRAAELDHDLCRIDHLLMELYGVHVLNFFHISIDFDLTYLA